MVSGVAITCWNYLDFHRNIISKNCVIREICRQEAKKNPKLFGNKLGKTWLLACSSHHSWLIKISIVAGYEIHRRLVRQDMPWQNNIGLNSPSVMVAFSPGFVSCCPISSTTSFLLFRNTKEKKWCGKQTTSIDFFEERWGTVRSSPSKSQSYQEHKNNL